MHPARSSNFLDHGARLGFSRPLTAEALGRWPNAWWPAISLHVFDPRNLVSSTFWRHADESSQLRTLRHGDLPSRRLRCRPRASRCPFPERWTSHGRGKASGRLYAMSRCAQLQAIQVCGPDSRCLGLSVPGPCLFSKLFILWNRLSLARCVRAETVAFRRRCVDVFNLAPRRNLAPGRICQATALPMASRRRQENVRSCEQPRKRFRVQADFHTRLCIHCRRFIWACLNGNFPVAAMLCVLQRRNSREFAAANNADLSTASANSAAVCVQACHDRFLSLVRGSAERRSGFAIGAPSQ